jgi:drug/metabolite transporter (DMT)-like permease
MAYLCVLLFFLFFAGIAMTIGEGLWTNSVNFMLIVVCSLAGVAFGYPLGDFAREKFEKPAEFNWYFYFAGVWLVFFVTIMITRIAAERLSKVRAKFVPPLESAAGPLMGLLVATIFTSFFAWTLLKMPIEAGEWKISGAPDWQKSTMQYFSAPFHTVAKASLGGKDVAAGALK